MLTVTTLNILNDLDRWRERGPLIVGSLRALQPDLIALQEVALPDNTAQWIADRLDGYSVYLSPKTGKKRDVEALAILSRLPADSHETLPLINQNRTAQRVTIRNGVGTFHFVNAHLYWNPFDDRARFRQVSRILDWLSDGTPSIVCGDFNAEPHFVSIDAMRTRFASAHHAANGYEPDYTCPTPLHRGPGTHNRLRRWLIHLGGPVFKREAKPWRGTLDYIFVDPAVRVHHCRVAFHTPAPHDAGLYPSDHLGLVAKVAIESAGR
ncbi:MAG TPA: endonuclease/exonuclease/phosphatase family protein [Anaerolineae bacterium]